MNGEFIFEAGKNYPGFEILETERLLLRKLTDVDYAQIFNTFSDEEIMDLLHIEDEAQLAIEKAKQQKGYATFNKSFLIFQLLEKHSKEMIGWCGYHTWYLDHSRAEVGYGLNADTHKSKGIMSEALKAILEYGFQEIKLNRVEAFIGPNNVPSLKLVEKFNFTREGQLRQHYFKNGKLEDSVVFGLLKEEYHAIGFK